MSQKNILMVVIVVLVLVGGLLAWFFLQDNAEIAITNSANNSVITNTTTINTAREVPAKNTVWIIDGNFNPSVVTISAGETITWVNKDDLDRQPASDPHPAHTNLEGFESDALVQDGEYSYTFNEIGEWFYHDHLNPISKGTIIVK